MLNDSLDESRTVGKVRSPIGRLASLSSAEKIQELIGSVFAIKWIMPSP